MKVWIPAYSIDGPTFPENLKLTMECTCPVSELFQFVMVLIKKHPVANRTFWKLTMQLASIQACKWFYPKLKNIYLDLMCYHLSLACNVTEVKERLQNDSSFAERFIVDRCSWPETDSAQNNETITLECRKMGYEESSVLDLTEEYGNASWVYTVPLVIFCYNGRWDTRMCTFSILSGTFLLFW